MASSCVRHHKRRLQSEGIDKQDNEIGGPYSGLPMTIRGGGDSVVKTMAFKPLCRMDPPPRSFAADAHDCIMVRSSRINRIQGCGAISAPAGELPSNCRRLAALQGKLDQPSLPPCS